MYFAVWSTGTQDTEITYKDHSDLIRSIRLWIVQLASGTTARKYITIRDSAPITSGIIVYITIKYAPLNNKNVIFTTTYQNYMSGIMSHVERGTISTITLLQEIADGIRIV